MRFIYFKTATEWNLEPNWKEFDKDTQGYYPYTETVNFILDYFRDYNIKIIKSGQFIDEDKRMMYFANFTLDDFPNEMSWLSAYVDKYIEPAEESPKTL